jgi:tRNA modification GTPase
MITLVDTAGLRSSDDPVEAEGMLRSRRQISRADLVLILIDGSVAAHEDDMLLLEELRERSPMVVVNKADLPMLVELQVLQQRTENAPLYVLSTRTGEGCQRLREALAARCLDLARMEPIHCAVPNHRHREALERAGTYLDAALDRSAGQKQPLDQTVADLRSALAAIDEITGETATEEILERIFSRFCVGK